MTVAYLDCTLGAAPAAILGAWLDGGVKAGEVEAALKRVVPGRWKLRAERVEREAVSALRAEFRLPDDTRRFDTPAEVRAAVRRARLPAAVAAAADKAYELLARAEAKVHRVPASRVHFHEVGRPASVLAVIGSLVAARLAGVAAVFASPLPFADGVVRAHHGTLPLPAPAALELLKGLPLRPIGLAGEFVTPSGAALVRALATRFGTPPAWTVRSVGYGAAAGPGLCRVLVGETA